MLGFTLAVLIVAQHLDHGAPGATEQPVLCATGAELVGARGEFGQYRVKFAATGELVGGTFFAELNTDAMFRPSIWKRMLNALGSTIGVIFARPVADSLDRIVGSSDRRIIRIPRRLLSVDHGLYSVRKLSVRRTGATPAIRIIWSDPRRGGAYAVTKWVNLAEDAKSAVPALRGNQIAGMPIVD